MDFANQVEASRRQDTSVLYQQCYQRLQMIRPIAAKRLLHTDSVLLLVRKVASIVWDMVVIMQQA